ncbi:MAG TPA: N-acetylmuramoyl-L-alanine amidase [Actinomycetota bacterium]|jgi:hypothetical protein|nr:N-acetylmuramoyl-L-alanine amidase [Actinomycetota bacterium]
MPGNPHRVADLHRLAEIWEGLGLRVLEMPGWERRGRSSRNTFEVLGCHHTGDPFDTDRILRDGRPDLNGPLCNVALHGNGEVVLVASGLANHFGAATWPNGRSLGVEATGPQKTGPRFPNYDAYVALAAGFCIFKGEDPRRVVRDDVGIPIHLVAGHKEVAVDKQTRTIYGRKSDPAFEGQKGRIVNGRLSHGFSVHGSLQLLDTFRDQVHARMTTGDQGVSASPTPATGQGASLARPAAPSPHPRLAEGGGSLEGGAQLPPRIH